MARFESTRIMRPIIGEGLPVGCALCAEAEELGYGRTLLERFKFHH